MYTAAAITLLMVLTSGSILILGNFYFVPGNARDFITGRIPDYVSRTALYLVFLKTLIAFITVIVFKSLFKKSSSPEMFFILVAVAGFSFEGLRSVVYLSYYYNWMYNIYLILPRVIYFGKLIAALSLFISGLFSAGFPVQKQNVFLGLSFIFSILLSSSVPIDFSANTNILLPGDKTLYIMQKVIYSLYILAALNYFAATSISKNRDFIFTGLGLLLFSAGIELTFQLYGGILLICGFGSLVLGILLTGYSINKIYSWI